MAIRIAQVEPPKVKEKLIKPMKVKAPKGEDGRKRSGFASMTPERRKEVAANGGASVTKEKRHFSTNPDKAREAGKKGGFAKSNKGKSNDKAI